MLPIYPKSLLIDDDLMSNDNPFITRCKTHQTELNFENFEVNITTDAPQTTSPVYDCVMAGQSCLPII